MRTKYHLIFISIQSC